MPSTARALRTLKGILFPTLMLTLALGTVLAFFSFYNELVLKPLPFEARARNGQREADVLTSRDWTLMGLSATCILASLLPALRILRVHPAQVLRRD